MKYYQQPVNLKASFGEADINMAGLLRELLPNLSTLVDSGLVKGYSVFTRETTSKLGWFTKKEKTVRELILNFIPPEDKEADKNYPQELTSTVLNILDSKKQKGIEVTEIKGGFIDLLAHCVKGWSGLSFAVGFVHNMYFLRFVDGVFQEQEDENFSGIAKISNTYAKGLSQDKSCGRTPSEIDEILRLASYRETSAT